MRHSICVLDERDNAESCRDMPKSELPLFIKRKSTGNSTGSAKLTTEVRNMDADVKAYQFSVSGIVPTSVVS
ncbi:MAG: hypothetical protein ACKO9S_02310, partial [Bacteroidota bacterium]